MVAARDEKRLGRKRAGGAVAKNKGQRLVDERLRDMEARGDSRVTAAGNALPIFPLWSVWLFYGSLPLSALSTQQSPPPTPAQLGKRVDRPCPWPRQLLATGNSATLGAVGPMVTSPMNLVCLGLRE